MILQALDALSRREELLGDPDFEPKPVTFLAQVGPGGAFLGFEDTRSIPPEQEGRKKPRPVARTFLVPREPSRTSGDRAFFLADKAEYALGLDPETHPKKRRPAEKLERRFALFRERVRECLEATGDEAVEAVNRFLEALAAGEVPVELPEGCAGNDLFTFVYSPDVDRLVLEREAVRRWWKQQRQAACAGEPAGRCLVTGELAPLADRHTILKQVPGAVSSGVPLVSFNAPAFESYGLSGNENAPISREAAESYAAALQRLLHAAPPDPLEPRRTLPRRNLRLSDDTAVCYWPAEPSGEGFASALGPLLEGNEETVGELYRSVWFGRAPRIADPSAFYALTISGAQGRAIVRGWLESTVAEVAGHVARHFADLEMVRNLPPPKEGRRPPRPPLRALLASLAVQGKSDLIPAPLAARLVVAALSGAPYPLALLQRAILRARAESGDRGWAAADRRDARAALLKAVLERRRRLYEASTPYPEIRPDMDPNNTNPGYLLGRLMAVIERLQQTALGDVNATVVDRYFGAASAAPRSVFIRLLKNARHHARKAKEDPAKQGMGHWLDRQLDELCKGFDPEHNGFPAHLSLEEQGLFILGYHQQRHWLWLSKDARAALAVGQEEAGEETDAG